MAPHSSFAGAPGWAVGPAGFGMPLLDSPAGSPFQGPGLEPNFSPAFGPYAPASVLPPSGLEYPGVFPNEAFQGPYAASSNSYVQTYSPARAEAVRQGLLLPAPLQPPLHERGAGSLEDKLQGLALNPRAKEFVPPKMSCGTEESSNAFVGQNMRSAPQSKAGITGRRKMTMQKQLNLKVKRTVYICDIDQSVTEEELADIFDDCGKVQDCRVCGDPNSAMRFAFIEFEEEEAVPKALAKAGMKLGPFSLRILPSKTAIIPVNNKYLPRTEEEREECSRTIYVANIDKRADKRDVKNFFENLCGAVTKLRLLGDMHHMSRIAFVEFEEADSANRALDISGALLGMLPLRISPSKTPVRNSPSDIQSHRNGNVQRARQQRYAAALTSGSIKDEPSTANV